MFVLGLDIGYSNLKACFGNTAHPPQTVLHPAGAAPVDRLPGSLRLGQKADGFLVQVGSQVWATGINPARFEVWERSLHPDYPATDAYRALFHTALVLAGVEAIDLLITGLPVSQFSERAKSLSWMEGEHLVAAKRKVEVKKVQVVPQPVGGFMAALAARTDSLLEEGKVLVVDPGHFSFDWVLICDSQLQKRSSGSSTEAFSVVLEQAAGEIGRDHGGRIEADRIEQALQEGKDYVLLFGQKVEIAPYLDRASQQVAEIAAEKMRSALRSQVGDLDAAVLVGGGAPWWRKVIAELFPKARVILPEQPILANARGFFELGAASE